jgi:hypothetical protein
MIRATHSEQIEMLPPSSVPEPAKTKPPGSVAL